MPGVEFGQAIGDAITAGWGGYQGERKRKDTLDQQDREGRLKQLQEEVRLMIAQLEEGGRNSRSTAEETGRNSRFTKEEEGRNERFWGEEGGKNDRFYTEEGGKNDRFGKDLVSKEWVSGLDRAQREQASKRGDATTRRGQDLTRDGQLDTLDQAWDLGVMGTNTTRRGQDISGRRRSPYAGLLDGTLADPSADALGDPWAGAGAAPAPASADAYPMPAARPTRRSGTKPAAGPSPATPPPVDPARGLDALKALGMTPQRTGATPTPSRTVTVNDLAAVAKRNGTTVDQERRRAETEGFIVR